MFAAAAGGGCASVPYQPGQNLVRQDTLRLRPAEPQVERGEPYWLIDGVGWVLGIPGKIILWNRKVENHHVTTNTQEHLAGYLADNDLGQVKVRINQYAPHRDWSRLFRNKRVGWGWRYTIGVFAELYHTIIPGRLIGGDYYDPYTDTIHIFSDVPAVVLHEGGHAKDFAESDHPGSYAALGLLPFTSLYFEKEATTDVIRYLRAHGTAEEERDAYKILFPAYGTYVGSELGILAAPAAPVLYVTGVLCGHVAGRIEAANVDDSRAGMDARP